MKKILFLFIVLSLAFSASAHSQDTSVPQISIEEGETFEPNSDELSLVDEVRVEVRHDNSDPSWDSEIQVEGQNFNVQEEEDLNGQEGYIEADTNNPVEIFEDEVDFYAEANDALLVERIILKGDPRFENVKYAEETGTGTAEKFDPVLELNADHPDDENLDYTFYEVENPVELGARYTFTTCGQEGPEGPEQAECDEEYENTSLEDEVDLFDGVQEWEVPYSSRYNITSVGAQGTGEYGGRGAEITAEVFLEEGDTLRIVSAQQGDLFDDTFTSGGGASFITRVVDEGYEMDDGTNVEPILIAGGGGGSTEPGQNQDANLQESGEDGEYSGDGNNVGAGEGGEDGEGGSAGDAEGAGSGAGLLTGGDGNGRLTSEDYANSFLEEEPVKGGDDYSDGGFGGGGASIEDLFDRAGGGGGYSGGGSATGSEWAAGGGGGSYVTDEQRYNAEIIDQSVSSTGQGIVEVEFDGSTPEEVIGENNSVSSGEVAEFEWSDRENFEQYSWTVKACEEDTDNCVLNSNVWDFTVEVPDPSVDFEINEFTNEHAFNATADIRFGRDNHDSQCDFSFTNLENSVFYEVEDVEIEQESEREGVCEFKVIHDEHEDFDGDLFEDYSVLDDIEVEVNITDHGVGSTVADDVNEIPNQLPTVLSESPSDGSFVTEDDVVLETDVLDTDDELINISFIDARDGEVMERKENVDSSSSYQYDWEGLNVGQEYEWIVELEDPYEVNEESFTFTRLTSESFRPQQVIDYDYSTVIVSEGDVRDVVLESRNRVDVEQNMRLYLEGVESSFVDSGESSKEYSLDSFETKEFPVRIEPEDTGMKELNIVAEDTNLGVNTTTSIPVNVRGHPPAVVSREVSGVGFLQILFISLTAFIFYFLRL